MEQLPHALSVALGTLPLLGAGVLVLIVAALAADRDRWIVPGTVAVALLVAGISGAMEYGPQMRSALASRPTPAVAVSEQPGQTAEPASDTPEQPEPAGSTTPSPPEPAARQPSEPTPADYTPGDLVSVPAAGGQPTMVIDRATGRRTMVVNPNAVPGQPATVPAVTAPAVPATRPAPLPTGLQPVPAQPPATPPGTRPTFVAPTAPPPATIPPTRPTTVAQNRPPELPNLPSQPGAPAAAGTGTLVVKISGPLVETAQNPSSSAHVMAILDGKEAHARGPSRTTENRKDNDPSQPVLATTYFWENITFTFNNVEAGYHVLMVDSSLDNQGSHRGGMTGSGQDKNDWNGSIEVKAGQTTVVEFGAKNWMNGQLARIR